MLSRVTEAATAPYLGMHLQLRVGCMALLTRKGQVLDDCCQQGVGCLGVGSDLYGYVEVVNVGNPIPAPWHAGCGVGDTTVEAVGGRC